MKKRKEDVQDVGLQEQQRQASIWHYETRHYQSISYSSFPNILSLKPEMLTILRYVDDADKTCRRKKGYPECFNTNV